MAAARLSDGAAAGLAGLRPGDGGLLRPGEPGRAAVVAQGRAGRGVPDRGATRAALGRAPLVPPCRPGAGAEGRVGAIPLVARGAAGRQVLPGDPRPGGNWHVAFAAIPKPVPSPGNGQVVGVDRARVKLAIAKLKVRQADMRKEWAEKTSTDLAHRFDVIRVENRDIKGMTRSARGNHCRAGPQRRSEGRPQPRHPRLVLGPAGAPPAGQGTGPGGEGQCRLHEPALLGVRACRSGEPQEPSSLRLRSLRIRLQRRRERGQEHRRRACGDCAGRRRGCPACEPRTSTTALVCVVVGILALQDARRMPSTY